MDDEHLQAVFDKVASYQNVMNLRLIAAEGEIIALRRIVQGLSEYFSGLDSDAKEVIDGLIGACFSYDVDTEMLQTTEFLGAHNRVLSDFLNNPRLRPELFSVIDGGKAQSDS